MEMRSLLALSWFVLALQAAVASVCPVSKIPSIQDVSGYLMDKEALVRNISSFAVQNYQNRRALAANCNQQTCSKIACVPLRRDLLPNALTCNAVVQNEYCTGRNNHTCTTSLLSDTQAYLRLSPELLLEATTDDSGPQTCDVVTTVCAQQALDDQIFKSTVFNNTSVTLQAYVYFGSSNGILRIFPGRSLSPDGAECTDYEVRTRPWYVGATAIVKEVVVLLDAGHSLNTPYSVALGTTPTFFDASRNVTSAFLDTLTSGDNVSVYTFGFPGTAATAMVGEMVTVDINNLNSSANSLQFEVELGYLKRNITSIPRPSTTGTANLAAGLLTAVNSFSKDNTKLKVIIIITAGDFTGGDLPSTVLDPLTALNARVFTYRFLATNVGEKNGNDTVTAFLQNVSCVLNGSYNEDTYNSQNPLGTLQTFYSYVASFRLTLQQDNPFWVHRYPSPSGVGDLIAVAYPAFDGDFLVGVAGVSILIDSLDKTNGNLESALDSRKTSAPQTLTTARPPLPHSCTLQFLQQTKNCSTTLGQGYCSDVDTTTKPEEAFKERVCCKECCPWKHSNAISTGAIIGIVFASIAFFIGLGIASGFLVSFLWKIHKKHSNSKAKSEQALNGASMSPPNHRDIYNDTL